MEDSLNPSAIRKGGAPSVSTMATLPEICTRRPGTQARFTKLRPSPLPYCIKVSSTLTLLQFSSVVSWAVTLVVG